MSVLCLYFPRMAVEIACRRHPNLKGRGIVFLEGAGDDAVVAGRSPEAACRGIFLGMRSGEARRRVPGIAFLPANGTRVREELGRMATNLSEELGLPVSIAPNSLIVPLPASAALDRGGEQYVERLAQAVAADSGMAVVCGVGSTVDEAAALARSAARRPAGLKAIG